MLYLLTLLSYSGLTIYTSWRISRSVTLSRRQKTANIVINALMPGLWFYLIKQIIFPTHKLMTREERERLIREESGSKVSDGARSSMDARSAGSGYL